MKLLGHLKAFKKISYKKTTDYMFKGTEVMLFFKYPTSQASLTDFF